MSENDMAQVLQDMESFERFLMLRRYVLEVVDAHGVVVHTSEYSSLEMLWDMDLHYRMAGYTTVVSRR
jgi:hypothetical protein